MTQNGTNGPVGAQPRGHKLGLDRVVPVERGLVYSSLGRGSVLPPGAVRTLLRLPPGAQALSFWQAAQTRLETVICYCSIYDECWRADTREDEPVVVPACREESTTAFAR